MAITFYTDPTSLQFNMVAAAALPDPKIISLSGTGTEVNLYGGTWDDEFPSTSSRLYKFVNGVGWEEVAGTPSTSEKGIMALAVFEDELFCSTSGGPSSRLFRWTGSAWEMVADHAAGPGGTETGISAMVVFDGQLYGCGYSKGGLYRWTGAAWEIVATQLGSGLRSLVVLDDVIYAGSNVTGQLFRWIGTGVWISSAAQHEGEIYISSLVVLDGKIYAGTGNSGKLFRWDSVALEWETVADSTELNILSLAVMDGEIYGGTRTNGRLYQWNSALEQWDLKAPKLGFETDITSLVAASDDITLYGGTGFGRLHRWQVGDAIWTEVAGTLLGDQDAIEGLTFFGTPGTLDAAGAVPSVGWLTASVYGSGNVQYVNIEPNANAQALAAGVYEAAVEITAANAENSPLTVSVTLTVLSAIPFGLTPTSVQFTPGRNWELPAAQDVYVDETGYGAFAAPVVVTDAPDWLQVVVDATDPLHQIISLTPISIPVVEADFSTVLTVTGSTALELPVSMVVPAFFRRPGCQMDFIPKVEGTVIETCDVPAPPPPAPVAAPQQPPVPAPTLPTSISVSAPPCVECEASIEYLDEEECGYGKPRIIITCPKHGCLEEGLLEAGIYDGLGAEPGPAPGVNDNRIITAIMIDECGHICKIYWEPDDLT